MLIVPGKTLLAKAVANQTSATFLRVVGSELIQKYLGDGPKLVRELFRVAEEHAPSIVFIDEIDAIGTKRYVELYFKKVFTLGVFQLSRQAQWFFLVNVWTFQINSDPKLLSPWCHLVNLCLLNIKLSRFTFDNCVLVLRLAVGRTHVTFTSLNRKRTEASSDLKYTRKINESFFQMNSQCENEKGLSIFLLLHVFKSSEFSSLKNGFMWKHPETVRARAPDTDNESPVALRSLALIEVATLGS